MLWSVIRLIFKTSSVTPDFFYVFNLVLSFSTCSQSFKKICTWELLGANVLKSNQQKTAKCIVKFHAVIYQQQSGTVEACWAHNPEVRGSKPRSARNFFISQKDHKRMSEDVLLIFTYGPPIKLKKNQPIGDKRGKKRAKKYRP